MFFRSFSLLGTPVLFFALLVALNACSQKESSEGNQVEEGPNLSAINDAEPSSSISSAKTEENSTPEPQKILARGEMRISGEGVGDDFILFAPMAGGTTYLLDKEAKVVKEWQSDSQSNLWVYMRDNGNIIRGSAAKDTSRFTDAAVVGQNGSIKEYDWDNNLVWEYSLNDDTYLAHHDIELLPNGNVLVVAWENEYK